MALKQLRRPQVSVVDKWYLETSTTMADPGTGKIRCNNALTASTTQLAISTTSGDGLDATSFLLSLDTDDIIFVQQQDTTSKWIRYQITATPTNNTTWFQITVVVILSSGLGSPAKDKDCGFQFALASGISITTSEVKDIVGGMVSGNTETGIAVTYNGSVLNFATDTWNLVSATWTRTGNYTFTVSGDVTAIYRKGAKVRYKDGGSYEYGVIASSSYSNPNTTVTLITNTDYAMAAVTITDKYLSYIENPEDFPDFFNYSTTISATSGSITTSSVTVAKWKCQAKHLLVFLDFTISNNGTGASILTITSPVTTLTMATGTFKNTTTGLLSSLSAGAGTTTISIVKYDGTYPVASSNTMRGFMLQDF